MRCFSVLLVMLAFGAVTAANGATRQSSMRAVRTAVIAQPVGAAITVVPFAVPVAVPVAVISQPAVLYSYRQYSMPAVGAAGPEAPPAAAPTPSAPVTSTPAQAAAVVEPTVALLAARCAKCHSGEAPAGHLQIFDAAGQIVSRLPRRAILEMVSPDESGRQRMPPAELPKLNADELAALREWARPPRDLAY